LTVKTDKANPLRIGLMLRAIDDVDGQGICIRKLCDALFDLDTRNEYVAFLQRRAPGGLRSQYRLIPSISTAAG
jgi:hypothetical protein